MSNEPLESISSPPETIDDRGISPFEERLSRIFRVIGYLIVPFVVGFFGYQIYKYFAKYYLQ